MWKRLKEDRRVQVSVGVLIVVLALKWLFTGSLLFAMGDMFAQPREGETKSGIALSALLPVVLDVAVATLAAIGAWMLNLGEWMFGHAQAAAGRVYSNVTQHASDDGPPVVTTSSQPGLRELTIDLGRAAIENDTDRLEELRWRIRKPRAIELLSAAYESGDTDAIDALKRELDTALAGKSSAQANKKGGGNNVQS